MSVSTANMMDREGALLMIEACGDKLEEVVKVLADGGYTGEKFAEKVKELLGAEVEIAKRSELHTFGVIPKRWGVERSFGWLEKCHRLWRNCERKLQTSLQMSKLAFIRILLNRC
jgi:transposase